jgi:hypothetical protein
MTHFFFNGINGATGEYGFPPMTGEQFSACLQGEAAPDNLAELKFKTQQSQECFGVKEGIDPKQLAETGWGIIFASDADPAIKEALSELLNLRQQQAGDYFKVYEGRAGYRRGESKSAFLARHGAGPGPADPEKVPYYLLLIGSPDAIPYPFQYQLDVQYAVGRLAFATPEEYARYARSVVAAETGAVRLPRHATFFGVANPNDQATTLSADQLILPLVDSLRTAKPDWTITAQVRDEASKAQLARLLGGDQTPALLFTASHGMEFPQDDPRQISHQGALLCQDWPGPKAWGKRPIPQDHYFAGDDVGAEARLLGLITFHFACYGAGTPLNDDFSKQAFKERRAIAPYPFVAGLPTKLLSHPRGGALAAVGHVERAWGYSFLWPGAGRQTTTFESTLERLLDGYPVGAAVEYINERYAELASDLSVELEEIEYGKRVNPYDLAGMWTANNDARSYVIIGDPAVRLATCTDPADRIERPSLDLGTIKSVPSTTEPVAPIAASESPPAIDPTLAQAQTRLVQALEQFLSVTQAVSTNQPERLQATVAAATHLLNDLKSVG